MRASSGNEPAVSLAPPETLHGFLAGSSLSQGTGAGRRQVLPDDHTHMPPQSHASASAVAVSPHGAAPEALPASACTLCKVPAGYQPSASKLPSLPHL